VGVGVVAKAWLSNGNDKTYDYITGSEV